MNGESALNTTCRDPRKKVPSQKVTPHTSQPLQGKKISLTVGNIIHVTEKQKVQEDGGLVRHSIALILPYLDRAFFRLQWPWRGNSARLITPRLLKV